MSALRETGIVEEKRLTTWYVWKCPKPKCRKKLEATVKGYTITNAGRHLEWHSNQERKATRMATREAQLAGAIEVHA